MENRYVTPLISPADQLAIRAGLEARIDGLPLSASRAAMVAGGLIVGIPAASRHLARANASLEEVENMTSRSKIRDCMCCRHPILSQHAGSRLCESCSRRGD